MKDLYDEAQIELLRFEMKDIVTSSMTEEGGSKGEIGDDEFD